MDYFNKVFRFMNPNRKMPGGVRSGDRGGRKTTPKNALTEERLRLTCQHYPTPDMFPVANTPYVPNFC